MTRISFLARFAIAPPLLLLAAFLCPARSGAQYIYLDTNGDGVHTDADVVAPGSTHVDVWLDSDHDRDGTQQTCNSHSGAVEGYTGPASGLDFFSYDLYLIAENGAVDWGTYRDALGFESLPNEEALTRTENRIHIVRAAPIREDGTYDTKPPGLYKLGSMVLNVIAGTPSLRIGMMEGWDFTCFGTHCNANEFPNSYVLGYDFFDADGAAFGGKINHPPHVDFPGGISVFQDQTLDQVLTATDEDGEALSFVKYAGPGYATVSTLDPGTGQGRGSIHLAPSSSDVGGASVIVRVSDGIFWSDQTIMVTVKPLLSIKPLYDVSMLTREVRYIDVGVENPSNMGFTMSASGPAFVTVQPNYPTTLVLAPTAADLGVWTVRVDVISGTTHDTKTFGIRVDLDGVNHRPSAVLDGPGSGAVGRPISFNASRSSDPDGDLLDFSWAFGDGSPAVTGQSVDHRYVAEGDYAVDLTVRDPEFWVTSTKTVHVLSTVPARAFFGGDVPGSYSSVGGVLVRVQPLEQSFTAAELTASPASSFLLSDAAGHQVPAIGFDAGGKADGDGDGIADVGILFPRADVMGLVDAKGRGRLTIQGSLALGGTVVTPLTLVLPKRGGPLSDAVSPNPMNPFGQLSFILGKSGPVDVKIFDVSGRLAHHPIDRGILPAGYHEVLVGRGKSGEELPSGIYYYRIETQEGVARGRFAIVR